MSTTLIAKFHCNSVKAARYPGSPKESFPLGKGSEEVALGAVYGKENEPWSSATPSGVLNMTINNPSAMGFFEPGEHYILTIEKAPKE